MDYYTQIQLSKMFNLSKDKIRLIFSFERFESLLKLKPVSDSRYRGTQRHLYRPKRKVLPKESLNQFRTLLKDFQAGKYYKEGK